MNIVNINKELVELRIALSKSWNIREEKEGKKDLFIYYLFFF